jgi:hypothetical protein
LKAAKAALDDPQPADTVFPTKAGTVRDRHNVRARVLAPVIERANKTLTEAAGRRSPVASRPTLCGEPTAA